MFAVAGLIVLTAGSRLTENWPTMSAWAVLSVAALWTLTMAVAEVGSFAGWALGVWLGIRFGNLLSIVSSLVMSLWTFWFGVALMRRAEAG